MRAVWDCFVCATEREKNFIFSFFTYSVYEKRRRCSKSREAKNIGINKIGEGKVISSLMLNTWISFGEDCDWSSVSKLLVKY